MAVRIKNNAVTYLSAALSSTDTAVLVVDGTVFPPLGSGDEFNATLQNTAGNLEIVTVTNITGNTLSVTRAQEGTLAIPFASGSLIELRVTEENLSNILIQDGDKGDITASSNGSVWQINALAVGTAELAAGAVTTAKITDANVTYAKIQNISAQYNVLGRSDAAAGPIQEIATSANFFTFMGAANYAAMRTQLGLVVGTNIQAWDADLDTWSGLTPSANFQTLVTHTFAQMRTDLSVPATTLTLTAAGLVSGGGDLSANRTFTVTAASAAETRAQTSTTTAVTPANLADRASFKAHKNGTAQTGVADNTATQVTFGTEVWDVGSHFASSAWTPPAGKVRLSAGCYLTGSGTAGGAAFIMLYKNGALLQYGDGQFQILAGSGISQGTWTDVANGTDVYTIYGVFDTTASTATFSGAANITWFEGEQI